MLINAEKLPIIDLPIVTNTGLNDVILPSKLHTVTTIQVWHKVIIIITLL